MQARPTVTVPFPTRHVEIPSNRETLTGDLQLPENASGIVIFAHGTGSGRHSPRNRFVARQLNACGVATLLIDLLTESEEADTPRLGHLRFDVDLLATRLLDATAWATSSSEEAFQHIAYFGASTGAAAALVAAAGLGSAVEAVVSRGGRPDLARERIRRVIAPTLLVVGGRDDAVLKLNRRAFLELECEKALQIVPGATHLFEEPGALERVTELAAAWVNMHVGRR